MDVDMEVEVDLERAPIGSGRIAEVYAVDDRRVVKLLRPEWPPHFLDREEHAARMARLAGIRTPAVLGTTVVDGRPGIVFERVPATSMIEAAIADLDGALVLADRLGDLQAATLATSTPGLGDVKELLERHITLAELDPPVRAAATRALHELPDGARTLHFDLHPGNVLVDGDELWLIDWSNGASGAPGADLARSRVLMTPAAASTVVDLDDDAARFVVEFAARYTSSVLGRLDVTDAEVEAWLLPVVAARVYEVAGAERDALRAEATRLATLRS